MKAIETTVELTPADAEATVREALAEQGFGVLTEIDVSATFKDDPAFAELAANAATRLEAAIGQVARHGVP